jgi:hypothetical protein
MRILVLSGIVALGLVTTLVSGYYLLHDWSALQASFARFEQLAARPSSPNALSVAEARQNVHRLNCFAEGVGLLLGAILAAVGVHGLCLLPPHSHGRLGCGDED